MLKLVRESRVPHPLNTNSPFPLGEGRAGDGGGVARSIAFPLRREPNHKLLNSENQRHTTAPPPLTPPPQGGRGIIAIGGPLLVVVILCATAHGADPPAGEPKKADSPLAGLGALQQPFPERIKAPSLDGGQEWLNSGGEITLKDLRGKIVVLDFWTYCCINCMHVLPDLKHLEKKFDRELVVIGVHSAKFDNEKDSANIRRAIQRYEIEHPVINDSEMTIWQKYGIRSWPTLIVIDPEGYACVAVPGEGRRAVLELVIKRLITYHAAKGTLDRTPVHFELERRKLPPTPLRFPGKVLADVAGRRLFISDSNHNRIVVASLDGRLIDVIGNGLIGKKEGTYSEASFDHPQGLALAGDKLYVADTENHLIREVDLQAKRVKTLAGTGRQAPSNGRGGTALQTDLNSPWDVAVVKDQLYVAMAGPHQIWKIDPEKNEAVPYAGSGDEDIVDGSLSHCALAQPSGLATDGQQLFVVDSEGSSVRQVPLDPNESVTTIVGTAAQTSNRLFTFGDKDGVGAKVRLQHPLGIALHDGNLLIADTYNHKIKSLDVRKKRVTTILGDRTAGNQLEPLRLSEPAGITVAGNELFVADTNNHRVVRVDLKTRKAVEFIVAGLKPPVVAATEDSLAADGAVNPLARQRVAAGKSVVFQVLLRVPSGFKLNREFPISCRGTMAKPALVDPQWLDKRHRLTLPDATANADTANQVEASVPLVANSGASELKLSLTYGYCREGEGGLCKLQTTTWSVPMEVASDGAASPIRLEATVPAEVVKSPESK